MKDLLDVISDEITGVLAQVDRQDLESAVTALHGARRVFAAGAGRSGFMASAFAMRLVHLGLDVHVVGEATAPASAAGDALVAVSGSGTTSGTVRAAQECRRAGGEVLAVTTDPDSELASLAEHVLHLPAATKYRREGETASAQPLSSLFDQCVHLVFDAVCLRLAQVREVGHDAAKAAHVNAE